MNQDLLEFGRERIEQLYPTSEGTAAIDAMLRLEDELRFLADTEVEQQLLTLTEIAQRCCEHHWPVCNVGGCPSLSSFFLMGLNLAEPIKHRLPWGRFFNVGSPPKLSLVLRTTETYVEPLKKVIESLQASEWIHVTEFKGLQVTPFMVEQDLKQQGKAPNWNDINFDEEELWKARASENNESKGYSDILSLHRPQVLRLVLGIEHEIAQHLAAATAVVNKSLIAHQDTLTWIQREQASAELLKSYTEFSYGVLIFEEDIMLALYELAGFKLEGGLKVIKLIANLHKDEEMSPIEERFIAGAKERGHSHQDASNAFRDIRRAAKRGLICKAVEVSQAVLTCRGLYLKKNYPDLYQLYSPWKCVTDVS